MLKAALAYAALGWRVHPIKPGEKTPLVKAWQKNATVDPATIKQWWDKWPNANIGIAVGEGSGFFVLDIDGVDGELSFAELETEIGKLPKTLEARTGSGGRHLLFLMPQRDIRNKQSFMPKLDIRGNGGYIVVAPSIHPNGNRYEWPYGMSNSPIQDAPEALLDIICPIIPELPVQEPVSRPSERPQGTRITERASLYLQECEPATQGAGGHDALLWAARALVVGFEMSAGDALMLLWADFNPRCSPPWNRNKPDEAKDFERKVAEVQRTPGQKPRGWLLDECGLRSDDEAMQSIGRQMSTGLLASIKKPEPVFEQPAAEKYTIGSDLAAPDTTSKSVVRTVEIPPPVTTPQKTKFIPFPIDCLPAKTAEYAERAAAAHCVDQSFTGLPVLIVAAAAMGNAFRLKLKEGFEVPPTLWGGIVAASGTNKSGPLRAITAPLRNTPAIDDIDEDTVMLNPQNRLIISDATLEAVVAKLASSPRGLCCNRNELAGWVKSFNAYKKSGGDEQAWLEFWDAHEYQLDRKTNNEELFIPAASVSIIGGIQPKVLVECFDPGKFASGLVPRLLIAHPPPRSTSWTEMEIKAEHQKAWARSIMWLRTRPFASLDTNNARFVPHILKLSPTAKARYIEFFDDISHDLPHMDEMSQTFASKSRMIAARLALCVHGLALSEIEGIANLHAQAEVSLQSMEAGVRLARWFLNEQIRVYGLASTQHSQRETHELLVKVKVDYGGAVSARKLMRSNGRKYKSTGRATDALNQLVAAGVGTWDAKEETFTVNP